MRMIADDGVYWLTWTLIATVYEPILQLSVMRMSTYESDFFFSCFSILMTGDNMSSKSYSCVTVRRMIRLMQGVSSTYCSRYIGI